MNNKKLFAILTLVAFMMTLLPVAAFAAADRNASILTVDDNSVEADGEKDAEFTVYVRDNNNAVVANAVVYIASERGLTTDNITVETGTEGDADADDVCAIITNEGGKAEFNLTSSVAGVAEIAVGLNNDVYNFLIDNDYTAYDAEIIGTETITFEATDASDIELTNVKNRDGDVEPDIDETDITAGDRVYWASDDAEDLDVKANGVDYYRLYFTVTNSSNAPVEGETVEFSCNKSDVTFNKEEDTTDEIGEVDVKIYAEEAGTYKITATVGSDQAVAYVEFEPAEVADIQLTADIDEIVATDEDAVDSFKVKLLDANENKIDPDSLTFGDGNDCNLEFEWISEPSESDLDDDWAWDDVDAGTFDADYVTSTNDNLLKIYVPEIEEEGSYVLRVSLDNGKYVDVDFDAQEQGDITSLTIAYDNANLGLEKVSDTPTVKRYDADGVALSVDNDSEDLEYAVNDYRGLLDTHQDLDDEDGVIYATDDDDYIGEYVVTVVDTKEDLTASCTVFIGDAITTLDVEVPATLSVGEETAVKVSLVDAQGNVVGSGNDSDVDLETYVISQPAGANASAEATDSDAQFESDMKEDGVANVDLYSKFAGEVNVTFVVKVTAGGETINYTKTVTFNFAAPTPKIGADNVTLFIGSAGYVVDGVANTADVAPFIQDGRTFVPVRIVAEALGADVNWDAATQAATIVRADKTITLTIGSNVLAVSDGTTVVADVAPFIKDGRTVLPFRAIGEVFGATVDAVFAADGSVSAVTFVQ